MLGQGTCKSLFIHAGLPLQLMLKIAQQASTSKPDILLEKLNTLVQGAVQNCSDGHCTKYQADLLTGGNSPVWYRGYVQDYEAKLCPEVQQVVQTLKVQRIVSGHNVMQNGKIRSLCGGRVTLIDVGISHAYFGNLAVWRCSNNSAHALYPSQIVGLRAPDL
ncbi:hypothetical protein ABBQ38_007449 [Trebouxia sp. C0009 RCD-2024]